MNRIRRRLQILANRELQWGKWHGAAFDQKESQWLILTHRQLPEHLPVLTLGEVILQPQPQIKWLGVIIDRKLTFAAHGRAVEKKGSQVALQLARLARIGWGIPLSQCLQLTSSLIHSRTDYAASVWHQQGKNTATVKSIQRINNVAQRFTLGVFKTHPLIFLKHDTASPSALHRLDARAQKAVARLLTLPDSNPAAVIAREALAHPQKSHRSCLHHTLFNPTSVLSDLPEPLERIDLSSGTPITPHPQLRSMIAPNRTAAELFVRSQLGPLTKPDPTRALSFSDGSLIPGKGIGAASVHLPSGTLSPANLGNPSYHTVYEAELVGIRMAAEVATSQRTRLQRSFWFFIDNQPSIRALTQQLKPTSGLALRQRAVEAFSRLITLIPTASINLVWCPAHVGIEDNEAVDEAAKAATKTGHSQLLPTSLAAVKQLINAASAASVSKEPPTPVLRRLRGFYDPSTTRKALAALPQKAAAVVAQLRAGHTPLGAFLHRINALMIPTVSIVGNLKRPNTFYYFVGCTKPNGRSSSTGYANSSWTFLLPPY